MIVVDVNVLVLSAGSDDQRRLARELRAADAAWAAPPLWRSEFLNVLAGFLRLRDWTVTEATEAFGFASTLIRQESSGSPEVVIELAAATSCTAYDLEYIALAHALDVPLVTLDRQLLEAFPAVAVSPTDFVGRS